MLYTLTMITYDVLTKLNISSWWSHVMYHATFMVVIINVDAQSRLMIAADKPWSDMIYQPRITLISRINKIDYNLDQVIYWLNLSYKSTMFKLYILIKFDMKLEQLVRCKSFKENVYFRSTIIYFQRIIPSVCLIENMNNHWRELEIAAMFLPYVIFSSCFILVCKLSTFKIGKRITFIHILKTVTWKTFCTR